LFGHAKYKLLPDKAIGTKRLQSERCFSDIATFAAPFTPTPKNVSELKH
jgi:hypothetical protein